MAGSGPAARWRRAAGRPAVLRALVVVNVFVGLQGAGAVAYAAISGPEPVQVGPLGGSALRAPVAARPPTGPQPAPVAIDLPSIDVHSDLVTLDVDPTGMLEVPEDFDLAGWWAAGPAPGADGAAVVVGHLDSHRGPAVFFRVPTLEPGEAIEVRRADGSTAVFVVDAVRQYSKDSLPTREIYGPTPAPELRLITCGGRFDRRTRSYEDNIVVFAHQREPGEAGPAS